MSDEWDREFGGSESEEEEWAQSNPNRPASGSPASVQNPMSASKAVISPRMASAAAARGVISPRGPAERPQSMRYGTRQSTGSGERPKSMRPSGHASRASKAGSPQRHSMRSHASNGSESTGLGSQGSRDSSRMSRSTFGFLTHKRKATGQSSNSGNSGNTGRSSASPTLSEAVPSPFMGDYEDFDEEDEDEDEAEEGKDRAQDLEAGRRGKTPKRQAEDSEHEDAEDEELANLDDFIEEEEEEEFFNDKKPEEWMGIKDTVGLSYLYFILVCQVIGAVLGMLYLLTAFGGQLSWESNCWGIWTSVTDTTPGLGRVEFQTVLGWKGYGKGDQVGGLGEVSKRAARVGGASASGQTFCFLWGVVFSIWALVTLWKSREVSPEEEAKRAKRQREGTTMRSCLTGMELAVRGHTWAKFIGGWMVFMGFWCLMIGVVGYYAVIVSDFSDGLHELIASWGTNVSCDQVQTYPLHGFIINGLQVIVQLGGGGLVLFKVSAAAQELKEANDLWIRDQAEIQELKDKQKRQARLATYHLNATAPASPKGGGKDPGTPLPEHWEAKIKADGQVFYINHQSKQVTWDRPKIDKMAGS
ncbi:unnamed protein product [Chrysoparadoxa australica]